jgi:hypothetical protein
MVIYFGVERLGPWWTGSFIENLPLSGEPIRCQSDHGGYACPQGGDAMSNGDGTDSSTRVPVVRREWALVVTSYHV